MEKVSSLSYDSDDLLDYYDMNHHNHANQKIIVNSQWLPPY